MKIRKIYSMFALAALAAAAASCEGEDGNYEWATPVPDNCQVVYFSSNSLSYSYKWSELLDPSEMAFSMEVCRTYTDTAVSVPLTVASGSNEIFLIPETVDFAAGQTTAQVWISVFNPVVGTHSLVLALDGDNVNPYAEVDGSPLASISVTIKSKDDKEKEYAGTVYSDYYGSWPVTVTHVLDTNVYTFSCLYESTPAFTLVVNDDGTFLIDESLSDVIYYPDYAGYYYEGYNYWIYEPYEGDFTEGDLWIYIYSYITDVEEWIEITWDPDEAM